MTKKVKIDFSKYISQDGSPLPPESIYIDPRPRIKNIVKELEEDHDWTWPPEPPTNYDQIRASKARSCPCLYSREAFDVCTILALITGPLELFLCACFLFYPKTFVPGLRESSEYCFLFMLVLFYQGMKHTLAGALGLGLRSMRPYLIGFVHHAPSTYEMVVCMLGLFFSCVGLHVSRPEQIEAEMKHHLEGYNDHWFSKEAWDSYQTFMHCCGINDFHDWITVELNIDRNLVQVPAACCVNGGCTEMPSSIYPRGCLYRTTLILDIIFFSSIACMLVGIFLGMMGQRSLKEAFTFVGDPIHAVLFKNVATPNSEHKKRKEELLPLLDHYCLQVGHELGFEEVPLALQELGLDKDKKFQSPHPPGNSSPQPHSTQSGSGNGNNSPSEEPPKHEPQPMPKTATRDDSTSRLPRPLARWPPPGRKHNISKIDIVEDQEKNIVEFGDNYSAGTVQLQEDTQEIDDNNNLIENVEKEESLDHDLHEEVTIFHHSSELSEAKFSEISTSAFSLPLSLSEDSVEEKEQDLENSELNKNISSIIKEIDKLGLKDSYSSTSMNMNISNLEREYSDDSKRKRFQTISEDFEHDDNNEKETHQETLQEDALDEGRLNEEEFIN